MFSSRYFLSLHQVLWQALALLNSIYCTSSNSPCFVGCSIGEGAALVYWKDKLPSGSSKTTSYPPEGQMLAPEAFYSTEIKESPT